MKMKGELANQFAWKNRYLVLLIFLLSDCNKFWFLLVCVAAGSVRLNPLTSKASNAEIEKEMKEWLKFASERDGGRQERNVKRQSAATAAE